MRDDFQIPNLGNAPDTYDQRFFTKLARTLEMTLMSMRSIGTVSSSLVAYTPVTVDALPVRARVGWSAYASNGRKNGEGVGAGTGVLVFYDGNAWVACDTGQPVSA